MSIAKIVDRFAQKNPLAVMTRCIIDSIVSDELDDVFEQHAESQFTDSIRFSTLAKAIAEIALGTVKNRNQAYKKYKDELDVTKVAFYRKLNRTDPSLAEVAVRYSAEQAQPLMAKLDFQPWSVLPGYRCFALDGNHLQKTEKRLKETRGLCAAPLPGTIVARYDLQSGLFDQAYLLEDGHAQESTVLDRTVEDLQERDLLIADRHFCIVDFFFQVVDARACFVIRQHGRLKGELKGKRTKVGKTETGVVYEQSLEITKGDQTMVVRRITVCVNEPTREGDTEIHILTNVPPSDANGCELADLYRQRWEIENAFHVLTMTMRCESKSNCYPRCALFQFCMAMLAYNCRMVLMAALYAEHDNADVDDMSQYQVALDIVQPMQGMLTAINEEEWSQVVPHRLSGKAEFLRKISHNVDVGSYRKSKRGPKKPKPKRKRCKAGTHVSTKRLLQERMLSC